MARRKPSLNEVYLFLKGPFLEQLTRAIGPVPEAMGSNPLIPPTLLLGWVWTFLCFITPHTLSDRVHWPLVNKTLKPRNEFLFTFMSL